MTILLHKTNFPVAYLYFILLTTIVSPALAQEPPETQWTVELGGDLNDGGQSIQETSDGGFIVTGYYQTVAGDHDVWLVKLDLDGEELWNRKFGGSGTDLARAVKQTADGGYIIAGHTDSYGAGSMDVWLIKTDSEGVEEWNRTFGGVSYDMAYDVIQTADGGYLVAGNYYSGGNFELSDGWLIKTDALGAPQWDRKYGAAGQDFIFSVIQTADLGFIFTGSSDPLDVNRGIRDVWVVKTNNAGVQQWEEKYDGAGNKDFGRGIQETADGGYIVIGNKRYVATGFRNIWLVKISGTGVLQSDSILGGGKDSLGRSIQPTSDGGYIISGFLDPNATGYMDFALIKIDENFVVDWEKFYFNQNHYDEAFSAHQTTDGGYVIAGYSVYSATDSKLRVIKAKPEVVSAVDQGVPGVLNLQQNFPNPFNPHTNIAYSIGQESLVEVAVYDISGRKVAQLVNSFLHAGDYSVSWDGCNSRGKKVASGVYTYRLTAGDFEECRTMTLVK